MSEADAITLADIDETLSTTGKPREGGCLYANFSPDTCTLPTDAAAKITELAGWVSLGDLTGDGIVFSRSATASKLKGHQGTVVISETTEQEQTVAFTLIEPNRPSAAKLYYGADSVVAGADGSVSEIHDKLASGCKVALCEDSLESNGFLRRTVVPKVVVDTFSDVNHKQGDFISYGVTGTAIKMAGKDIKTVYRAKPVAA